MIEKLDAIVDSLLLVPSIANGIESGFYTEEEARIEFIDQILNTGMEYGLACVEDIPTELWERIISYNQ